MNYIAVEWLEIFEGSPEQLIKEIKGENSEKFKLMALFLIENRTLALRKVIPPLIAASFFVKDKKFTQRLLNEASIVDIAETIRLLRQGTVGIGLNKRIRQTIQDWLYSFSGDNLELETLAYPESAKEIIDLVHTNPEKFCIKWWQSYIYGASPPKDSLTAKYLKFNSLNLKDKLNLIKSYPIPWTYLLSKIFNEKLPEEIIEEIIDRAPFMYLIHYLNNFTSFNSKIDRKLAKRLIESAKDTVFNFGLVFKKYLYDSENYPQEIKIALLNVAQTLLENTRTPELAEPVFIIGDNSGSMQPSIEAAVLMSCILAQKLQGCRLLFFNDKVTSYKTPENVNDILKALQEIKATGSTAIASAVAAAAMQGARTIILISDGGHNTPSLKYEENLKSFNIDPILPKIDFFYLMVRGDYDCVWNTYKDRKECITRLIDLKKTNVSFIFGFLKIMLQFFNYDPNSNVWNQIEAIKGAFLPEMILPTNIGNDLKNNDIKIQSSASLQCVICGSNVTPENAILLICGHRFHKDCLERYWELLDGERRCVFNCQTTVKTCVQCGGILEGDICNFCGTKYLKL